MRITKKRTGNDTVKLLAEDQANVQTQQGTTAVVYIECIYREEGGEVYRMNNSGQDRLEEK